MHLEDIYLLTQLEKYQDEGSAFFRIKGVLNGQLINRALIKNIRGAEMTKGKIYLFKLELIEIDESGCLYARSISMKEFSSELFDTSL